MSIAPLMTNPCSDPSFEPLGEVRVAEDVLVVTLDLLDLWRASRPGVTVVAIDGFGASGKSTLAEGLRQATGASVVHTDHFVVPAGRVAAGRRTKALGPLGSAEIEPERALDSFYDLARLRTEALEPLRAGRAAVFHAYDEASGLLCNTETRVAPGGLVLLEGLYSSSPQLGEVVDRSIYVETLELERLRRRQGGAARRSWDKEWRKAETAYFEFARPLGSFDLAVPGTGAVPPAPPAAYVPTGSGA